MADTKYKIENIWKDGTRTPLTNGNGTVMTFKTKEIAEAFRKAWANENSEVIKVTIITP